MKAMQVSSLANTVMIRPALLVMDFLTIVILTNIRVAIEEEKVNKKVEIDKKGKEKKIETKIFDVSEEKLKKFIKETESVYFFGILPSYFIWNIITALTNHGAISPMYFDSKFKRYLYMSVRIIEMGMRIVMGSLLLTKDFEDSDEKLEIKLGVLSLKDSVSVLKNIMISSMVIGMVSFMLDWRMTGRLVDVPMNRVYF